MGHRPDDAVRSERRFEELTRVNAPTVLEFARHHLDDAAAQDVVAEVFAIAWRKLERLPGEPRPWVLAMARRAIVRRQLPHRSRRLVESTAVQRRVAGSAELPGRIAA